eukprot:CAMPEP_0113235460 /NCGR_PEP_ID=MMETSP0008_2-20120614/3566_1 /TAXON_ID=97485 /ORGANISM="Prymnesium parvum" /LENGTH=112 /DNA_ID=CAMNT_0000082385 /DNA_START=667 /DNA_END=1005 /DNA_ORIENTATION=+ /assembly_acc=CAM_ASM_000153
MVADVEDGREPHIAKPAANIRCSAAESMLPADEVEHTAACLAHLDRLSVQLSPQRLDGLRPAAEVGHQPMTRGLAPLLCEQRAGQHLSGQPRRRQAWLCAVIVDHPVDLQHR